MHRPTALAALAALSLAACRQEQAPPPASPSLAAADTTPPAPAVVAAPETPAAPAILAPAGRFETRIAGMEAHAPSGPARFCTGRTATNFVLFLHSGTMAPGVTLVRETGRLPRPDTYAVADSSAKRPDAFWGMALLRPSTARPGDAYEFEVTGGEVALASVDSARAEGTFRIDVASASGAPRAGTVTGSFRATYAGPCETVLAPPRV